MSFVQERSAFDLSPRAAEGRVYTRTILTLAFVLRVGVGWIAISALPRNWFFNNAADLGYLAQSIAQGRGMSSPFGGATGPTALVTPGYPLFVALFFRIFGRYSIASAATLMLAQILFAVTTVWLTIWIAHRLFGAQAANLAGFVSALSLPLLWLPTLFWETCLSILLLVGAMALALKMAERSSERQWIFCGLYCGVAVLVNPALIPAMAAMLICAAAQRKPASVRGPLLAGAVMLAIFLPWPIRNAFAMHSPVMLRSSFGYELWQGNRPGGDGKFDDSLYPLHSAREFEEYSSRGELAYMRDKLVLAEAYIRANPAHFFLLTAKRIARFWSGTGGNTNLLQVEAHCIATLALGLAGLGLLYRRSPALALLFLLPLLLFPLPYYITDIKFRYRFVIDPFLTILAAYAVVELVAIVTRKRARTRGELQSPADTAG
jgi:4-amino-4-deoxy-L-arabinose transferase-like glycosyltransferase